MLPWVIIAFLLAMSGSGTAGLYFGSQYEANKATAAAEKTRADLATAYGDALKERDARLKELQDKGGLIEGDFLSALQNMQVVNKTYYNEVQKETEKLVYTDCKLPTSGVDLLNKHIDEVNARLLRKEVKK